VRQQRCERREKHDVERDDRAQQQNQPTHLSTVSSGFSADLCISEHKHC
jgi:hypothetical protein